jgi:hypothetical protein
MRIEVLVFSVGLISGKRKVVVSVATDDVLISQNIPLLYECPVMDFMTPMERLQRITSILSDND